jgi:uncharacterized cupredoxin-like copper-binding protein
MKARLLMLALVAAAAALLYAPFASPKASATKSTTVTVTMREFKFTLSRKIVPRGTIVFKLVNKGTLGHDFKIAGKKSKLVAKGRTRLFTVILTKGTKAYLCTVPGHATAGMKGTLKVT